LSRAEDTSQGVVAYGEELALSCRHNRYDAAHWLFQLQ
jgi:hypothetical protein